MRSELAVTIVDDPEAMADAAARLVVDAAAEAITVRGRFTLALAGGQTPAATYARLAAPPYRDQVDWAHVWAFFGDERAVPPDHPESNYRMAHEALLSRVPIPRTQVWRIRGEAEDAEAAAADHRGFAHKAPLIAALARDGHQLLDLGTTSTDPVDYPDYARAVGAAIREGRADLGVLICGSGAGVSIAANKLRGIRAALCHDLLTARQSREADDANVLCLGPRVAGAELAIALPRDSSRRSFPRAERHVRRLAKVLDLEARGA